MNEKNEQTKILESLNANYQQEKSQFDELNQNVEEIKMAIVAIKDQARRIENDIESKQKSKDEIGEKLTKRDGLIAYHEKQIRSFVEAMGKYEVTISMHIQCSVHTNEKAKFRYVVCLG